MVLCPHNHENLEGLSFCKVCGLPLVVLRSEFASLANTLAGRAEMGRRSPGMLLIGLGPAGTAMIDIYKTAYGNRNPDYSYLAIDTDEKVLQSGSGDSNDTIRLKLGDPNSGNVTFCGIGENVAKRDPNLLPAIRQAGLTHADDKQVVIILTGIGGGIGSAVSVLVEKCRQLNPNCHIAVLSIIPGIDESFYNQVNAYYGLARLLEDNERKTADLVIALHYDRFKTLRGVGGGGQELVSDSLLAAVSNLFINNMSPQYITEMTRINQSIGIKLVIPCLALGRSMEIFDSVKNVLESTIAYPANNISKQKVLTCHLLLRVPGRLRQNFGEESINEHLWRLVRHHLPGVKAASSSITYSNAEHDRVEACILLGGDSAISALFSNDTKLKEFREELEIQLSRQTYGLEQGSLQKAADIIAKYDLALDQLRNERSGEEPRPANPDPGFPITPQLASHA